MQRHFGLLWWMMIFGTAQFSFLHNRRKQQAHAWCSGWSSGPIILIRKRRHPSLSQSQSQSLLSDLYSVQSSSSSSSSNEGINDNSSSNDGINDYSFLFNFPSSLDTAESMRMYDPLFGYSSQRELHEQMQERVSTVATQQQQQQRLEEKEEDIDEETGEDWETEDLHTISSIALDADQYVNAGRWIDVDGQLQFPVVDDDVPGIADDHHGPVNGISSSSSPLEQPVIRSVVETLLIHPDSVADMFNSASIDPGSPISNHGRMMDDHDDPTMMIRQLWNQIQGNHNNNRTTAKTTTTSHQEEALHAGVFADETGFLHQSSTFKESLTDPGLAEHATAQRRSARFRQQQEQAYRRLKGHLLELDRTVMNAKYQQSIQKDGEKEGLSSSSNHDHECGCCPRCGCRLTERDRVLQAKRGTGLCPICLAETLLVVNPRSRYHEPMQQQQQPQRERRVYVTKSKRPTTDPH